MKYGIVAALLAMTTLHTPATAQSGRVIVQGPETMLLADRGSQIGVSVRDLDAAGLESQKVQGGVVIEDVRPESPAASAGLRAGDVVVAFDGERIRSVRQFSRLVQETPPGRRVTASIVRDGKRSDLAVTPDRPDRGDTFRRLERDWDALIDREALREQLRRMPEQLPIPEFRMDFPGLARARLGMTVDDLTPQLAGYFGAKEGVLVTAVTEETPAARGGLKAGDVIISMNGETVRTRAGLQRLVARLQADTDVAVVIIRDRKEATLTVRTDATGRTTRGPSRIRTI
jgi:serine protease Do